MKYYTPHHLSGKRGIKMKIEKKPKSLLERRRGKLFIVLNQRGLTAWRSDIVIDYTAGAETSTSALNEGHLQLLIDKIERGQYDWVKEGEKPQAHPHQPAAKDDADTRQRIRRAIISKLKEMGAITDKGDADMKFIYNFIKTKWKQPFNQIPSNKLQKILAVLETDWMPWFFRNKSQNPNFSIKDEKDTSTV